MAGYLETNEFFQDFIGGKSKAFNAVYHLYSSGIYVFAVGIIGNKEDAKDIVLESFTKLFEKHADFDRLPNIRSFLYVATQNSCFNYLKKLKRLTQKQEYSISILGNDEGLEHDEIHGELLQSLYKAVERLAPEVRRVIKLLYVEDLTYQEAATRLGISKETVKTYRKRGVDSLRTVLYEKLLETICLIFLLLSYKYCVSFL